MSWIWTFVTIASICMTATTGLRAAGKPAIGEAAPDFPPGVFSDGQRYQLADLKGKVIALYLYEKDCPTCLARTKTEVVPLVERFKGKPVKFIAVAAGDTAIDVKRYIGATQLNMPVYVDAYSLLERRYGETISLNNIYQWKIIDADGKLAAYSPGDEWMDRAMATARWTYKDDNYHAALAAVVDAFEWGHHEAGMKLLKPLRKSAKKEIAESAQRLYAAVRTEGQAWLADATSEDADAVTAYDAYTRLKSVFADDKELTDGVDLKLAALRKDKAVTDELAARKMMSALASVTGRPKPPTAIDVARGFQSIAKKYPDTPTGKEAHALAVEMGQ